MSGIQLEIELEQVSIAKVGDIFNSCKNPIIYHPLLEFQFYC